MSNSFVIRSAAAGDAQRKGFASFRTYQNTHGLWKHIDDAKPSPAAEWAKGRDWIAWVEADTTQERGWHGIVVVRITQEELAEEFATLVAEKDEAFKAFAFEPMTPDLWAPKKPEPSTTGGKSAARSKPPADKPAPTGERARSDIESPVKVVWATADTMKGATRAEVVAACVAKGVNKSTAGTQYYHWQKAQLNKSE